MASGRVGRCPGRTLDCLLPPFHPDLARFPTATERRKRGYPDLPLYENNEIVDPVVSPLADGRPEAVAGLARKGLALLDDARPRLSRMPRAARTVLIGAALARPVLRRAAQAPGRVAGGALLPPEGVQRARRLWVAMTGRV